MNTYIYIEKILGKDISKKSIIILCESINSGIVKFFKENISKRAFENLFFRQLYFLAKNKNFKVLHESIMYMQGNRDLLIQLFSVYHYELIFRDYREGGMLFRSEIFGILLQNNERISKISKLFDKGICTVGRYPMFSVNAGEEKIDIDLVLQFYNRDIDGSDLVNTYTLAIFSGDYKISSMSFLIGNNCILISNIQNFKGAHDYFFPTRYHKIFLFIFQKISIKVGTTNVISFSNGNHPCKYHKINNKFKGDYDNILRSIGFLEDPNGYLCGVIQGQDIRGINVFIENNIDYHFENICRKLQLG